VSRITVSTTIDAPPERVWAAVEDVGSHVDWMQDAVAINFTSDRTSGVGTEFDCDTRVGPFRMTDHMQITEWSPGRAMGVRHVGLVTGSGVFKLQPKARGRRTRFIWSERLVFPWWMGGPIGSFVAKPVFRHIWRTNLRNLKELVDGPEGT
jgi:uncharacterized protein YndB with AHSA1/START domain